jgi:hypothetical protein
MPMPVARHILAVSAPSLPPILVSVPPILDGIVAAIVQASGDLSPSLADFLHKSFDFNTLFRCNWVMVEGGLEILMIAFSALLGRSGSKSLGNLNPVERSMVIDQLHQIIIFLVGPGSSSMSCHNM